MNSTMPRLPSHDDSAGPGPEPMAARGPNWRRDLREAVRDAAQLCRLLGLPAPSPASLTAAEDFPVFVPRPYLARIRPGDPGDPLLRQALPLAAERDVPPGFSHDPVGDQQALRRPGLLRKYRGRALIVATGACAVHCRYCFRRHFPYDEGPRSLEEWGPALAELASDASIHEVILSGGDPLVLGDARLAAILSRIAAAPAIETVRVHTRAPVHYPERITPALVEVLRAGKPLWLVTHFNHPVELGEGPRRALGRLREGGVPLLNQSVLLAGVNDRPDVLAALCRALYRERVKPYYLHHPDRAPGNARFRVPIRRGLEIYAELRERLPGPALPAYVIDLPDGSGKVPVESLERVGERRYRPPGGGLEWEDIA
jgi:EF-P beta-lysylation protein EpmB